MNYSKNTIWNQDTKPLREIMLDIHETSLKKIYRLPKSSTLAYNPESIQICVDGIPIFKYLESRLRNENFVYDIEKIRRERFTRLKDAHDNPEKYSSDDFFHLQFDYEMLGIDHLIDTTIESDDLIPLSGKSFFGEIKIKELECTGNLLDGNMLYFKDKDFDYFVKHTMTRKKLLNIIMHHDEVIDQLRQRYDSLTEIHQQYRFQEEVFEEIKHMRQRQNLRSSNTPDNFNTRAIDYNEENRLLRSVSFYHVMKDKSIPYRFGQMLETRRGKDE